MCESRVGQRRVGCLGLSEGSSAGAAQEDCRFGVGTNIGASADRIGVDVPRRCGGVGVGIGAGVAHRSLIGVLHRVSSAFLAKPGESVVSSELHVEFDLGLRLGLGVACRCG